MDEFTGYTVYLVVGGALMEEYLFDDYWDALYCFYELAADLPGSLGELANEEYTLELYDCWHNDVLNRYPRSL